jgi:2-keto-3-deoxy-L-fuconate dehydrogenase
MPNRLAGKRAFITAAAQGIGRATALLYAAEGAEVFATDRDAAKLAELDAPNITTRPLDVLDAASIDAAIGEAGRIDVLFNCAGFVHQNSVLTATDAEWEFAFDLNVRLHVAHHPRGAAGHGRARRRGDRQHVLACSSIKGAPNRFVYGTTKAAVIGLTKSVATEFVTKGIRCNAICPGTVDTPSLGERIAANAGAAGGMDAARQAFVARQAMGRLATAEEIAALALYLASDESAFVTGQAVTIDGGWTL